uniref:Transient receptor potential cation channel subfamily A member 1-like n=1 Tax=Crassostrea virginica TaxID=6565 RepID=A0A8B8CKX6_CRAVI|nr:transient receptor potential cation channel subfamily A member 1-like [Crassostrea virginica]
MMEGEEHERQGGTPVITINGRAGTEEDSDDGKDRRSPSMNDRFNEDNSIQLESPSKRRLHLVVGASTIYPAYRKGERMPEETGTEKTVWQAIRDCSIKELDWLLTTKPEVTKETDYHGNTLLLIAAKYNLVESTRVLISHGVDVNEKNKHDGIAPLHEASKYGSADVGRLLIESGCDVMIRDNRKKTPLHHASRRGRDKIVEHLVQSNKCDIDARDEDKLTPLHESIIQKHENTAMLLIKSGADVTKTEINGSTPYMLSAAVELVGVMETIRKTVHKQVGESSVRTMVNQRDSWGNSALHVAVDNKCLRAVEEILTNAGDVNATNETGLTPLHSSAINGDLDIAVTLLSHEATVNVRDQDSFTPVHRACLFNRHEVLNALMKKGGDINMKTKDGMTPLILACSKGLLETVDFLLNNGAQISQADNLMRNALHWAVENAHLEVLLYLLKKSDSVMLEAMDHQEQTIMHYAAKLGNVAILQALIHQECTLDTRDMEGRTPLHVASEHDNEAAVEVLYHASNSELNDGDSDGQTPLLMAVKEGHYNSVKVLLSLGADIANRDENLCSVLHIAAREGHVKIMKVLLEHYADINATDKIKNTPLHTACKEGHVDCVQLLLDRNANSLARNIFKKTPLDVTLENRHSDVAVTFMKSKRWEEIIENRDPDGKTAVDEMIQNCPEAVTVIMDNCIESTGDFPDSIDYTQKLDFRFIDPGPDDVMCKRQRYFAFETMVRCNREDLLTHPLVQQCLLLKWRTFGRPVYFFDVTLFLLYLTIINIYCISMPKISTNLLDNVRRCPIFLDASMTSNQTIVNYFIQNGQTANYSIESEEFNILIASLSCVLLIFYIREAISIYSRRLRYLLNPFTYVTLVMLTGTSATLYPIGFIPCESQWRAAWIATLAAWISLISIMRALDVVGIYFVMLEQVFHSLLKIGVVLGVFLLAFSQAFYITMAQTPGFQQDQPYPATVLSMTLGELNFIDNFLSGTDQAFYIDNLVLFSLFALIMPISLMNLLIGVAVGDIDAVQKKAYLTRLGIQIDFLCNVEKTFPKYFQRKFHKISHKVTPNINMNSRFNRFYKFVFSERRNNAAFISQEQDFVTETVHQLKDEVKATRQQMAQTAALQKQSLELIKQLCDQLQVSYTLDNISLAESNRPATRGRPR